MHLPTLPLVSQAQVCVEGDVTIDPSAAIAPGVILRADPGSQIRIAAGVCIGMGAILHAHQGTLEVEAGANLAAGVLVVGKGKIGAHACIGAIATIWNASIEPWQVVSAASVVGDKGRQLTEMPEVTATSPSPHAPNPTPVSPRQTDEDSLNGQIPPEQAATEEATDAEAPTEPKAEAPSEEGGDEVGTSVYGQGSLDRILKTLFPYNQSLNRPPEDG
jgi:carbon dioxide concentrating mechanism protein CcmN